MKNSETCSCGRPQPFDQCCGPLLAGEKEADGPENLMRSRYSAFVHKNVDYLYETLDPQARYDFDRAATENWANTAEFTGLEILNTNQEGNKGSVEFKAHFKMDGNDQVHHELSKFRKQGGVWYFRDGKVILPKEKS